MTDLEEMKKAICDTIRDMEIDPSGCYEIEANAERCSSFV
jgi:hypothetical protein